MRRALWRDLNAERCRTLLLAGWPWAVRCVDKRINLHHRAARRSLAGAIRRFLRLIVWWIAQQRRWLILEALVAREAEAGFVTGLKYEPWNGQAARPGPVSLPESRPAIFSRVRSLRIAAHVPTDILTSGIGNVVEYH